MILKAVIHSFYICQRTKHVKIVHALETHISFIYGNLMADE